MAMMFWPPMQQFLGLDETKKVHGAMMVGYPKYSYKRIPTRNDAVIQWM